MKKLILFIAAISFIYSANLKAQPDQGKWLLGMSSRVSLFGWYGSGAATDFMSINFSTSKDKSDSGDDGDKTHIKGVNLSPRAGYFIVDNLVAGLDLNMASFTYKWESEYYGDEKEVFTIFSMGPFVRYYFPVEKVKPFVEGFAYFGNIKDKYEDDDGDTETDKLSNNTFGGGAGVAFPIGEVASFDLMLGYNSNTIKYKEDNEDNYRTVTGTFGIRFGFVFFLGKGR